MASSTTRGEADTKATLGTVARTLALITALTFILVGVVGFAITGFDNFAAHHTGEELLWFQINPLHNIVHLALGLVGLALFRTTRGATTYGWLTAVAYGGAFVYGLIAIDKTWDILAINTADNILHIGLAALGVVIAAVGHAAMGARDPGVERSGMGSRERGYGAPA